MREFGSTLDFILKYQRGNRVTAKLIVIKLSCPINRSSSLQAGFDVIRHLCQERFFNRSRNKVKCTLILIVAAGAVSSSFHAISDLFMLYSYPFHFAFSLLCEGNKPMMTTVILVF